MNAPRRLTNSRRAPGSTGLQYCPVTMGVLEWMIIKAVVLCIAVFIYGFWLGRKDRNG